jgi:mannose-1-phosphate guanylyltransferase/phosphomannomutase
MAAGAGTRLRPLTHQVPKPMVPIADRPVLEYTLLNLKRHGITEIVMNLHAYPEQIKNYFGDGSRLGLTLSYSYEPILRGTAGGVKKVESFLNRGTFLIMSGDGLTDINLTQLLAFHRVRRSMATMAVSAVDVRFEYGVTLTNATGRITRFVEKPSWGDVFSNQVNSGVYVFEPSIFSFIPKNREYDFGKQVWPDLLKRRKPIYAWKTSAYWCDVGSLGEYRRAQLDLLGKKSLFRPALTERRPGIWAPKSLTLKGIKVQSPCLIGENCRIAPGVIIGAGTVIESGVRLDSGVELTRSVIWSGSHIKRDIHLADVIVARGVTVSASGTFLNGAVIMKNDTLLSNNAVKRRRVS